MKNLLLTGFEPFQGLPSNPSAETAKLLHQKIIGGYRVTGRVLPVIFDAAGAAVMEWIEELNPAAVLMLGLAAGRTKISVERVAINCHAGVDCSGKQYDDGPIEPAGEAAYFATLPIQAVAARITENGLPAEISNSAGIYVCNYVMYRVLYTLKRQGRAVQTGLIHLPADHGLALLHPAYPSWSITDLARAVQFAIEAICPVA
jgi:pyroglutamyl-peptidase